MGHLFSNYANILTNIHALGLFALINYECLQCVLKSNYERLISHWGNKYCRTQADDAAVSTYIPLYLSFEKITGEFTEIHECYKWWMEKTTREIVILLIFKTWYIYRVQKWNRIRFHNFPINPHIYKSNQANVYIIQT